MCGDGWETGADIDGQDGGDRVQPELICVSR